GTRPATGLLGGPAQHRRRSRPRRDHPPRRDRDIELRGARRLPLSPVTGTSTDLRANRMNNLATFVAESAWADGDRVAVRQDEIVLTYAQLNDTSARVATLLQAKGVRAGDRVA